MFVLCASCTRFNEYAHIESEDLDEKKIGMLSFSSRKDLLNAVCADDQTSLRLMESATILSDSLKFISLIDPISLEMAAVDPILEQEGWNANINWNTNAVRYKRKAMYKVLGYDSLIPNVRFARVFNARGEVSVGDTVYKVSPKGTYFYNKSLQSVFEENYSSYENTTGVLVANKLEKMTEGIYRYSTFKDDAVRYINGDNVPDELPSEANDTDTIVSVWDEDDSEIYSELSESNFSVFGIARNNYPIPWTTFPVFYAGAKTDVGQFWEDIIGRNSSFTTQLSKKRRLKGSFYYFDYVVYSEIGTKAKFQKKNWIGWSGTDADQLFVGWNNIIFENSYEEIPTYPQNPIPTVNSLSLRRLPGFNKNANVLIVVGIELSELTQMLLSNMLPNQLQNWLSNGISNYNYNIEQIDAIQFYSANKVVTMLLNGFELKLNSQKIKHVFLQDWGFSVNLDIANLPNSFTDWANAINTKDMLIEPKDLKYGAIYMAASLDGQWGGMTIVKD